MVRRLVPHVILIACFAVFLSPIWMPYLLAAIADRPDLPAEHFGLTAVETTGSIRPRGPTTELQADARGHFETQAVINGRGIGVMIDTGATSVALRFEDAARLGLRTEPADFTIPISTANGTVKAARAILTEIRIGAVRIRNVEALVVPPRALATNLMGMSFLKRLSKVQIAGSKLVLVE
jgi:aspartyl protease family protein